MRVMKEECPGFKFLQRVFQQGGDVHTVGSMLRIGFQTSHV
jgi:hypothetical protein